LKQQHFLNNILCKYFVKLSVFHQNYVLTLISIVG